ncbi:MAG TPA: hypothetical protein DCX54_09450 [Flavobacteriales bacterium]|nr:hypothetical protein [Flavobacteriales bacterium]
MILVIGLFIINHLIVTLVRVYRRTEKFRYLGHLSDYNQVSGFRRGFERRVLKPTTFMYSLLLTLAEFIAVILIDLR